MAATDNPQKISPKVTAGAKGGGLLLIAVLVGAFILEGVTPELLDFLGPWATLISGAVVLAGTLIRSYWVGDPLRQNYWAQKEADEKSQAEQPQLVQEPVDDGYEGKHVAE